MRLVFRKTSLVDYPGKMASVLFFPGCNLRCPWCHNRDLVSGRGDLVSLESALAHIEKRRSLLGAVVLSGGEPTLYGDLPALIRRIKALALRVKLDTNGMAPPALERLFLREETRPDYIALDLKLAPSRYTALLPDQSRGIRGPGEALERSAALIRASGIPHEFRTLVLPRPHITEADIEALAPLADEAPWYFRFFEPGNCLDPAWDNPETAAPEDREALMRRARELGKNGICP
ncbi:MAG: anaerobic ribonucleoside-triphosphate reductase activating protein [Treponema sp.]|jgi:pyruvate formate lyase activating enzyme|nr:anaerobic ribonucleoside-triphosphate reductase activating protein [Treponema sp.]